MICLEALSECYLSKADISEAVNSLLVEAFDFVSNKSRHTYPMVKQTWLCLLNVSQTEISFFFLMWHYHMGICGVVLQRTVVELFYNVLELL